MMNVASCAESHGCSSNVTGGQGCWTVVEPGSSMKDSDTRQREYRSTRICGQADQPWQLWHSLNTLMGACDKNRLPKNCLSAQQFGDFFESKVATVRKATAGGSLTTELSPAPEIFDHFQLCSASDVRSVIMGSSSKLCSLNPLPTDMLKICLFELLLFITDLCSMSLQ